jgi:peptidoglycan-associated lipoprotein
MTPRRRASLEIGLLLALLFPLLAGCPGKPKYPECKTDPDCAEQKQVCVNGFCKECRDDSQCKGGFVCKANACVPKPQCQKNEDCPAGQKCQADKCVAECTPETAAQDCGQGRKCLGGRCAAEEECIADADCGQGKGCVQGRCQVALRTCKGDADCPDGQACVEGFCRGDTARRVCKLSVIFFDYDDSSLTAASRDAVAQDAQCLKARGARRVTLEGHTDERGTTEYNIALGSRRAEAVKRYLKSLAPDLSIKTVSFGKEQPADGGHDETSWAKNRRVEFNPEQ